MHASSTRIFSVTSIFHSAHQRLGSRNSKPGASSSLRALLQRKSAASEEDAEETSSFRTVVGSSRNSVAPSPITSQPHAPATGHSEEHGAISIVATGYRAAAHVVSGITPGSEPPLDAEDSSAVRARKSSRVTPTQTGHSVRTLLTNRRHSEASRDESLIEEPGNDHHAAGHLHSGKRPVVHDSRRTQHAMVTAQSRKSALLNAETQVGDLTLPS